MDYIRLTWILIFFVGTAGFSWLEWQSESISFMGWFFLTSIWSAVCGIAYTIMDWYLHK